MIINAKYFGEISYEENDIIQIMDGLFGFESCTRYLPLPFNAENDSMISLQSLEDESLSFIVMNPFMICPDYAPELSEKDLKELEAGSHDDISYYVISVIHDPIEDSTVNLRAPLAVNAINRKAKQVMLEQPEYTFRHKLSDLSKKEGE